MALEIMLKGGGTFVHDIRHDLESIFHVIIWVCCHMEGPEVERSDPFRLPVREWGNMSFKLHKLGLIKLSHFANFEDSILKHFTPYWHDFKPYIRQLKSAFWPESFEKPNCMTSERLLSILKDAAANVQDMGVQSGSSGSTVLQSYVLLNSKRSRQGQDIALVSKRPKIASVVPAAGAGGSHTHVQDLGIWEESVMVPNSDAVYSLPDSGELSS
jgi:hypothetical protein